jgi:ATP-dependent protease HslVU (ClpYQ) peptidase subunit
MSTIVVVRRGDRACIACDTLANIGSLKQKAYYCATPGKIFSFGQAWIGTVGYAVHNTVLQSYFARYPDRVDLDTPAGIFETWRQMHKILREDYHMNPRAGTDDAYETTRISALLATPRGIFGVTPSRDVESYPRFWAIGSGASFALGAMFTLFERSEDVEDIARAGVAAGAEFDEGSELPVVVQTVTIV